MAQEASDVSNLAQMLERGRDTQASVSLRPVGSVKILGDLWVEGLDLGAAIHLAGLKHRDQVAPGGTPATLTLILGDDVVTLHTHFLAPISAVAGDASSPLILRVAWPNLPPEIKRRRTLRVAAAELPPLTASLDYGSWKLEADLLNLTETGMGLGLKERVSIHLHAHLDVEAMLPGGFLFCATGEVRHVEFIADDLYPTRLGVVLGKMTSKTREALRLFVQARRADRSDTIRHGG